MHVEAETFRHNADHFDGPAAQQNRPADEPAVTAKPPLEQSMTQDRDVGVAFAALLRNEYPPNLGTVPSALDPAPWQPVVSSSNN